MKRSISIPALLIVIMSILTLSNCGEDPKPGSTPKQAELNLTTLTTGGAWNVQSVLVDGVDRTTVYKDLKVTFSASSFTTTSGGSVWPSTGTWSFSDDSGAIINRSDGVKITIAEIAAKKLVLNLAWTKTTLGSGRVASVSGQHVFTFTRP